MHVSRGSKPAAMKAGRIVVCVCVQALQDISKSVNRNGLHGADHLQAGAKSLETALASRVVALPAPIVQSL